MLGRALFSSVILSGTVFGGVLAQIADTLDIGAVTKLTRQTGNPELAAAYLSQEGRRHTAAELDALADSLVMIATTYERAGSAESDRAARAAVNALVLAANGPYLANRSRKLEKLGHPQVLAPYPRAFDALVRIFDEAADSGLRHGTLYGITQLPDSARVVASWDL